MSDTEFEGLNREEIIKRVEVMIAGSHPDFTSDVVSEIAEQTADQYLAERDEGAEPVEL